VEAELLDPFVLPHSADSQYRNTLSTREDDPLYIDKTEHAIMASEQPKLIAQMRWVTRLTYFFIAITVILLVATTGVWVWVGLRSLS
jgi:hypothetical protein